MTENLMYFAHQRITLQDIYDTLLESGYVTKLDVAWNYMAIFSESSGWWWIYDADGEYFADDVLRTIKEYRSEAAFSVALLLRNLPHVRQVLKELMQKYGGWAGAPTADFKPVYTFANIDELPLYLSDG